MRRPKLSIIRLLIIGAIAVLGWQGLSWARGSASTTTSTSNPDALANQADQPAKIFEGVYFKGTLPANMVVKSHSKTQRGIALEQVLVASTNYRVTDQLAITIGKLPTEGLKELSDINYRQSNKQLYESLKLESAPIGAVAFSRKDGFEKSVFWPHGSTYASVVVSGEVNRQDILSAALWQTLGGWQWQ